MKINLDCMYDTMTILEEELSIKSVGGTYFFEPMILDRLVMIMQKKRNQYTDFAVVYAAIQLAENGYIATTNRDIAGGRHGEIASAVQKMQNRNPGRE